MKLRVHHIAILCKDIVVSQDFYEKHFDFKVIQKVYREDRRSWKIDMKKDGVQIELFSFPNSPKRQTHPEACGLRHIAFAVKSLVSWHARMSIAGIECEEIRKDDTTDKQFFFVKDPDGLPIELYEDG